MVICCIFFDSYLQSLLNMMWFHYNFNSPLWWWIINNNQQYRLFTSTWQNLLQISDGAEHAYDRGGWRVSSPWGSGWPDSYYQWTGVADRRSERGVGVHQDQPCRSESHSEKFTSCHGWGLKMVYDSSAMAPSIGGHSHDYDSLTCRRTGGKKC